MIPSLASAGPDGIILVPTRLGQFGSIDAEQANAIGPEVQAVTIGRTRQTGDIGFHRFELNGEPCDGQQKPHQNYGRDEPAERRFFKEPRAQVSPLLNHASERVIGRA